MPTAILIDGAYFIKRFRSFEPHNKYNAERAADLAWRWSMAHLREGKDMRHDLYRIFFYDCPPIDKKMHNPVSKRMIDFGKSNEAIFRRELHEHLKQKRKVALRLGHLASDISWTIPLGIIDELLKGKRKLEELTAEDVRLNYRQKGVDMRIGIDISSLALKKQVNQIVLMAGDADFVPAAKLARREGVDFILDPMWQRIPPSLNEHIDGLRCTSPKPIPRVRTSQTEKTAENTQDGGG
ncbi:MAG: NYN domain-containing protein [Pseudomonadota bacterium]